MPCVTSHYMNPKNVFTPKPLNPCPMREVACHGLEWHSGPCPTLTQPWLDLESMGLENSPMMLTSQHGKIRQITPLCPKVNYILKDAYGKYPNAPCVKPESNIQG